MKLGLRYIGVIVIYFSIMQIYSQKNLNKTLFYVQFVYKDKNDSLKNGRIFLNIVNSNDKILFENFDKGQPCGGSYKFRDTFLKIINRNKVFFPLLSYEIANISQNDSNDYFNTFGTSPLPKASSYFYSNFCHNQLSFWCSDYSDLDSFHDIIFISTKVKLKGKIYKIFNTNKYHNEYSLYKISYNSKFKSNSVFFSKGITEIKKSSLFIPNEFILNNTVSAILVTKATFKSRRNKTNFFKPSRVKC